MERIKGKLKKSKVIDLSVSFSQSPKFVTKRCLLLNCKKKYETRHNINHHKIHPLCEWKPKKLKVTNLNDELQKIISLKEKGFLTNEEFKLAKAKILD